MTTTHPFPRLPALGFAGPTLALYVVAALIVSSRAFAEDPGPLSFGIAFDLIVGVPLLFYVVLVRPGHLSGAALAPVVLLSILGARLVLPPDQHAILASLPWLIVAAEAALVGIAIAAVVRGAYRTRGRLGHANELDLLDRLRDALSPLLPLRAAATVMAHELALLYYAFFAWRARPETAVDGRTFAYHRNNGYTGLFGAAIFLSLVEIVVVHLVVATWSVAAAWVLTAAGVYSAIWLLGQLQAFRLRPLVLTATELHLRIGLIWRASIPRDRIRGARAVRPQDLVESSPGYLDAAAIGAPRLLLELTEPVTVEGPYGFTKRDISRIGLPIDDLPGFIASAGGEDCSFES
jgi:hypothetical protein